MVGTAVDQMSIQNTVQNVNASMEIMEAMEQLIVEVVLIKPGLVMDSVMMVITIMNATLMAGTAVLIKTGLVMDTVMTLITIKNATLMVGIAVDYV